MKLGCDQGLHYQRPIGRKQRLAEPLPGRQKGISSVSVGLHCYFASRGRGTVLTRILPSFLGSRESTGPVPKFLGRISLLASHEANEIYTCLQQGPAHWSVPANSPPTLIRAVGPANGANSIVVTRRVVRSIGELLLQGWPFQVRQGILTQQAGGEDELAEIAPICRDGISIS